MNLGLPIDMEKGRAFTRVHGVDRAVGSGPNAFPVEMAGGNNEIRGTEMLPGRFRKRRRRVRREKAREGGNESSWGKKTLTPGLNPIFETALVQSLWVLTPGVSSRPESLGCKARSLRPSSTKTARSNI
jgi:hypothetical protein